MKERRERRRQGALTASILSLLPRSLERRTGKWESGGQDFEERERDDGRKAGRHRAQRERETAESREAGVSESVRVNVKERPAASARQEAL